MVQLTFYFEADILSGNKKHEYRPKFLNEPVNAFIYVSSPIKQIKAYIEFEQPIFVQPEKIGLVAEEEGISTASKGTSHKGADLAINWKGPLTYI